MLDYMMNMHTQNLTQTKKIARAHLHIYKQLLCCGAQASLHSMMVGVIGAGKGPILTDQVGTRSGSHTSAHTSHLHIDIITYSYSPCLSFLMSSLIL